MDLDFSSEEGLDITRAESPCVGIRAFAIDAERQLGLPAITGDSDTQAFVTENPPTSYSHVDCTVKYINHVFTMLVLHQLATRPIQLPS